MARPRGEAFHIIDETRPAHTYRAAVVGCGRMGSTIDDEHIGMAHYPWPWAHAPAIIEARATELVAAADIDRVKLDDFRRRWHVDALYLDYREMVEKEKPDLVAVTTRPEERGPKSSPAWPRRASRPSSPPNRCVALLRKLMP